MVKRGIMYLILFKEVIDVEETQMIEGILKEFAGLAKHPRKSGHEKEVSDYIVSRLRELGLNQSYRMTSIMSLLILRQQKDLNRYRARLSRAIWIWSV